MTGWSHHGADEVLHNVFWDLGQIGDGGGPKYSEGVLRRLAAKVLDGRSHEPLAFRLCHLVRCAAFAAGNRPHGWLEFFCAPGAGRSGWAAGWLRERLPADDDGPVAATVHHAALRYPGRATHVTLSYGAMPLLAAFMEFLLNTLHYRAVCDAVTLLSRTDLSWRELQDAANALSRAVYAWLRAHTRPVQDSRDFEAIAGFLVARGEPGDFTADDVDDAAVLEFWRTFSAEPDSEFRTFRKTFRAFLRFAEAMREETFRTGLEHPEALDMGDDRGEREVADPDSPGLDAMRGAAAVSGVWEAGIDGDGEVSPLEEVAGAEIKFLLSAEAKRLTLVEAHARLLPGLALSVLRDASFGRAQGRISQGLRTDADAVRSLVSAPPEVGYDDETAAFEKLLAHLDDLIAAAAALLLDGKDGDGGARALDFETLIRGRRALKGVRRKGFDELQAGAPDAVAAFREAAPAIIELRDRLAPLCARLREGAPWATRQTEDEPRFRAQFARIYGVTESERETGP